MISGHYDKALVCLSFIISVVASWVALDLAARISQQRNSRGKTWWIVAGACAMGTGIWSMHYVGMLAYCISMPILYDWPTVVFSLFPAILASVGALAIVSRKVLSVQTTVVGGLCMGGGIASMHYIGMAAMRMPSEMTYSLPLVGVSVIVAILISMVALQLTFGSKNLVGFWSQRKAVSALLMGLAIPIMHYLGMEAAHWTEGSGSYTAAGLQHAVSISRYGTTEIVLVSFLVLTLAIVSASIDRHIGHYASSLHMTEGRMTLLNQHSHRLRSAFRAGGVGIWECDPATNLFYVDARLRDMYDLEQDGLPVARELWKSRVHAEDQAALDQRWSECLAGSDKYENEYRVVGRDGEVRRYRSVASIVRLEDGSLQRVLGMTWDVTAERKRELEVADQAERFRMILEGIGDAVISTDAERRIVFANPVACQLTGWSAHESIGRPLGEVFTTRDENTGQALRNPIHRCIESGSTVLSEDSLLVNRNGVRFHIKEHVALMNQGEASVITFQDVTEARLFAKELKYAATHDALTDLHNRVAFEQQLQGLWEITRDSARSHCLCILDLDRFKIINDTSGHMAGDALLKGLAGVLTETLRPADFIARMGGDEFMLLLVDTNIEQGEVRTAHLLERISAFRLPWQGKTYDVTASVGVVAFDGVSPVPEVLISQADVASFTAKRNGRNRMSIYLANEGLAAEDHYDMETVADLRRSLENDCFELYAQPIVPIDSPEDATYFEVLVRMRNIRGKLISPSSFIPAAERYGLMGLLDRWVIRNALAQYSHYCGPECCLRLAINLSADSLNDPSLWDFVAEQFRQTGVPPSRITFEVTETGFIHNFPQAKAFLHQAQEAGSKVALDDFGTGLSSLSYLKRLPFNAIKVDGSFVSDLVVNPIDQSIIRAVAQIAYTMQAVVVAECVEDLSIIDLLKTLGVKYIQGWASGRPVPLGTVLIQNDPVSPVLLPTSGQAGLMQPEII